MQMLLLAKVTTWKSEFSHPWF